MERWWKRLKCDEEDEYDIPYYQTNREQSKEEFLSLPFTFKKEWDGTIFKAVESRILTTKISTNDYFDSISLPALPSAQEAELNGFEIKSGLNKMREQYNNDISSVIFQENFDASSKFDTQEDYDKSETKENERPSEFKFESILDKLWTKTDKEVFILTDIPHSNLKVDLNSTNDKVNTTMNDSNFKSKFTFIDKRNQISSYEEKLKSLNEITSMMSNSQEKIDVINLKSVLNSLNYNSPYIWKSFHFINQRKQGDDKINEKSSLKSYIIQTPLSVPKLSEIIKGVVEWLDSTSSNQSEKLKQAQPENSLNKLSKLLELSKSQHDFSQQNQGVNLQSNEEQHQEIIVLELQTRKKKASVKTNSYQLLQKPSKFHCKKSAAK